MSLNPLSLCEISPACSLSGGSTPYRIMKKDADVDYKQPARCRKPFKGKSPYLHARDRIAYHSRITEKRIVHKKVDGYASYPLTTPLYRTNSAELKESKQKTTKKVKKSVLTLPNQHIPAPQTYTVSDLNETEYERVNERKTNSMKLTPLPNRKKYSTPKERDSRTLALMNMRSNDTLKPFEGDGKRHSRKVKKIAEKEICQPYDVWKVLRDIKRFQYSPTPPMSIQSAASSTKKKNVNKRNTLKGNRRLIETCRTEEFSYFANFEFQSKGQVDRSRSSSGDRITVIDKINNKKGTLKSSSNVRQITNAIEKLIQQKNLTNKVSTSNTTTEKKEKNSFSNTNALQNRIREKKFDVNEKPESNQSFNVPSIDSSNYYANIHMAAGDEPTTKRKNKFERALKVNVRSDPRLFKPVKDNTLRVNKPRLQVERPGPLVNKLTKVFLGSQDHFKDDIKSVQKPRLLTMIPSAAALSKFNIADVRKKLANIKFPVTIMGKDEVSSNFEKPDGDAPQFNGIDQQIWPFMTEWVKNESEKAQPKHMLHHNNNKQSVTNNSKPKKDLRRVIDVSIKKRPKENKSIECSSGIKKMEQKIQIIQLDCVDNNTTVPSSNQVGNPIKKKPNAVRHLKHKVLNFIYKKSLPVASESDASGVQQKDDKSKSNDNVTVCKVDASTEAVAVKEPVDIKKPDGIKEPTIQPSPTRLIKLIGTVKAQTREPGITPITLTGTRSQPWSKGNKWASEFIDNVIQKVKSGVYYNQDPAHLKTKPKKVEFLEVVNACNKTDTAVCAELTIQTPVSLPNIDDNDNERVTSCMTVLKTEIYDPLKEIPGFDEGLSGIEIKSLTMNQISVKQCTRNILLQFDTNIKEKSTPILSDVGGEYNCIPLKITESHTKIFKCNTAILNAVLPAQLCFLLPRLLMALLPSENTSSNLLMIAESNICNRSSNIMQLPVEVIECKMSLPLKQLLQGRFSAMRIRSSTTVPRPTVKQWSTYTLILRCITPQKVIGCVIDPSLYPTTIEPKVIPKIDPPCIALIPYTGPKALMPVCTDISCLPQPTDVKVMQYNNINLNFILPTFINTLKMSCYNNTMTIDMVIEKQGIKANLSVTLDDVTLDSRFKRFIEPNLATTQLVREENVLSLKCIESINANPTTKIVQKDNVTNTKRKRRPYIKLYKKCKATANIVAEKSLWPLGNIKTMCNFCECLGSAKTLISVLDGAVEKNILSAICQMQSWITEISACQALLVLLLINKKESPNLIRFRELLLQGIAMNRISKASELDLEIAVLENENISLELYNGMPKWPVRKGNDSLFEELRWIAITTAADHKRPFDESSEMLLKSLLENRKKLNPSYLRVMARYVGLGLVKAPKTENSK